MPMKCCWIIAVTVWLGCLGSREAWSEDSLADFCSRAQQIIVETSLQPSNEIYDDFDAFTKSKPTVDPLVTMQYVWPEQHEQGGAQRVSCKMKTADHLQASHGVHSAGEDIGCRGVNQRILTEVMATMTDSERSRLTGDPDRTLIFADDIVTNQGPMWLEPYPMVARQGELLIIQAKGMRNDWTDPRYVNAPPQFRGTRYCHLITPSYLKALLLGGPVSAW